MPSRTLPTFTRAEVESHNTAKSCYVTIRTKVYDVSDFVYDHPGGGDLILGYAGKDVENILGDSDSHTHSEAAYQILDESLVGFVITEKAEEVEEGGVTADDDTQAHPRTGMSCEEDLSKDTDYTQDYKKHKFLDLSRPLLPQIWHGNFTKEFYLDQVHRPRHYRGGESAPIFGNILEPLTKTPWWVVPTIWIPCDVYGISLAAEGLSSSVVVAAYWILGLFIWTLVEYCLHRFLFHLDEYLPDNRYGILAHFLLHGIHHYLPMDKYRLVMPPVLLVVIATPFWFFAHGVFAYSWHAGTAVFCGSFFGYICYDMTHYFIHHENLPLWFKQLKKYHLEHHFLDYELGFGVTNKLWDIVFNTELKSRSSVVKTK